MASPGIALLPRRWFRCLARFALVAGAMVVILAGAFVFWFRHAARAALPALDGAETVAGISSPVTLLRDDHGVPHIVAHNIEDLVFAQGYATAQDRLWQMDMSRRMAAGELAEILGPSALTHDRQQRILGTRRMAERATAALPPGERAFYEAYARGVNAWMQQVRHHLPIEFRVLLYEPKPWRIQDSLLVGVNLHQVLSFYNLRVELAREKIYAKIGKEMADDLYPSTSPDDRWPGTMASPVPSTKPIEQPEADPLPPFGIAQFIFDRAAEVPDFISLSPGSNNWVVSGAHTVTGKPMLANDMHLPHSMPGIWYEMHLEVRGKAEPFNVAGVTLPGLPFVVGGHNQRIAWGFTNLGADVVDIYVERFNGRGEYLTPDGWKQPERRTEQISVRGWRDQQLEILATGHGPIITPLLEEESRQLAVRLAANDPKAIRAPLYDLNRARNWQEFRAAVAQFGGPTQNVVYADVDGNIGYTAMGMIPVRQQGDGSVPLPGDNGDFEWTGYVPSAELPQVFNPPGGIIATANSRVTPDGYRYVLTTHWVAPDRTRRLYSQLESGKKFTRQDMLALQMDVRSDFDWTIAQHLVAAVDARPGASPRARQAADILRGWNGEVRGEEVAPAIVALARRQLNRLLLEPKLGKLQRDYRWFMSTTVLRNLLSQRPPRWLNEKHTSYDDLLVAALEATLEDAPADLSRWTYGQQFFTSLPHPFFGRMPVLAGWTGIGRHALSGNGNTVKQVGTSFGPSQRLVVDLADLDRSYLNIVSGQSGQPFSQHYTDHWRAWYNGHSFELPFSAAGVERAARHRLILQPQK
jgi:penicillin amidase